MYYVIIDYTDHTWEEQRLYMMVLAASYAEAIAKATKDMKDVFKVTAECVQSDLCDVVYIPAECTQQVLEENYY